MVIKSSGRLSMETDIVDEFGGNRPHSLSEYYRGGPRVPNLSNNSRIPTTGPIRYSNFYGATEFILQSFSVPAVDTTAWYNNVTLSDYVTPYSSQGEVWTDNVVDLVLSASVTVSPSLIRIPSFSVGIQSTEDSDYADDDEYTGIRNPGIRIRNPDGTVLRDVRVSGQVFGVQTAELTIPATTVNATALGTYRVYFIADIYRSPEGDAAYMRWTSSQFNMTWETR